MIFVAWAEVSVAKAEVSVGWAGVSVGWAGVSVTLGNGLGCSVVAKVVGRVAPGLNLALAELPFSK